MTKTDELQIGDRVQFDTKTITRQGKVVDFVLPLENPGDVVTRYKSTNPRCTVQGGRLRAYSHDRALILCDDTSLHCVRVTSLHRVGTVGSLFLDAVAEIHAKGCTEVIREDCGDGAICYTIFAGV